MKLKQKNKIHAAFILTLLLFVIMEGADKSLSFFNKRISLGNVALAEDEEDEYEEEDEEDEEDEEKSEEQEDVKEEEPEKIKQIIRLPDQIVTKTIIETVYEADSDRDGLIDKNDPHPNIAEIYIVKDENLNGVDDTYELL